MSTFRYIGPDGHPAITQLLYRTVVQCVGEDEPIAEYDTFSAMPYAVGHEWRFHTAHPAECQPSIAEMVDLARHNEIYVIRSIQHLVTIPRAGTNLPLASSHVTFLEVEALC